MKWLIAAAVVCAFTYIGKVKGERYIRRYKLLSDLVLFCDYYVSKMRFGRVKLGEILSGFGGGDDVRQLLAGAGESLRSGQAPEVELGLLTQEEREEIAGFLGALGHGDIEAEEQTAKGYRDILCKYRDQAAEDKRKYSGMAIKLGFLFGLLCAVLII